MSWEPQKLNGRHREVLRLHVLGLSGVEVAARVNLTPQAIYCILRSPLAQAEVAKLQHKADEKTIDVPTRAAFQASLEDIGREAVDVNRTIMKGASENKLRAKIAQHFMDRIVFKKDVDDAEVSYRDILRQLDQIGKGVTVNIQNNVVTAPAGS